MQNDRKALWLAVLVLIVVSLACALPQLGKDKEEPETDLPAAQADIPLGETYRSEEGGFLLQTIPGYTVEEFYGLVSMLAPGADADVGPGLVLVGGMNEETKTNEQLLQEFLSSLDTGVEVSNQKEITIDGYSGISLDTTREVNGEQVSARVIIMALTPTRVFNVMGVSPQEQWDQAFESLFLAVLDTIRFFEPVADTGVEAEENVLVEEPAQEPVVEEEIIRQWAITAKASSEYDNPDWAAHQATGEPDTLECGDKVTAWASFDQFGIDWLEVGYAAPVTPVEVNIYESHTPTQVVRVELLDTYGAYHEIYTAKPVLTDCPYIVSIQVDGADYQAVGVKITVDQSQLGVPWDEIDAVELVGYTAGSAPQPVGQETQPTTVPPAASGDPGELASWTWTNYEKADGLVNDNVRSIAVAPDGKVWAGTFGGVSSFKNGSFTSYSTADGLGHNQVMAIEVTPDGTVWAGTIVGLSRFDGSTWKNYTKADGLIYESVYALALAEDGGLWVGTGKGVSFYDGRSWTSYTKEDGLVDNYVNDIAIDRAGGVWFATMKGVSYLYNGSWTSFTEEQGLALNMVNTAAVGLDGALWFGTSSGGTSYFDGMTRTTYADAATIAAEYVSAIRRAPDGVLWFATQGDGAFRFDGQSWLQFSKKGGAGLPSDSLEAVAVGPDGAIWFGTQSKGIVRFGP